MGVYLRNIVCSTWVFFCCDLAEGFFCQTTTSEERDLVSQGVEKDPFLLDDSFDHYLSRSSQESEEDITRYVHFKRATSQLCAS